MCAANNQFVGILALQGDYESHYKKLRSMGVEAVLVKTPEQLDALRGLIIPGGESTTILKLLAKQNFFNHIKNFYDDGGVIFGTCAGAILAAATVSPAQQSFGFLKISVERNAYGRQLSSVIKDGQFTNDKKRCECVFIRAPKISDFAKNVSVLVTCDDEVVCVQHDRCLVATYHPELSQDNTLHQHFLSMCTH